MTTTPIAGYRTLSQAEVDFINEIKAAEGRWLAMLERVAKHLDAQSMRATGNEAEMHRLDKAQPGRWLAMARTDAQTSSMFAVRAVAQPGVG